jgi:hypothetical protein
VLTAIEKALLARVGNGYWSPWGLAFSGNPIDHVDETLNAGVGQLEDAPDVMSAWYELRALVLRKQSNREEKIGRLRAFSPSRHHAVRHTPALTAVRNVEDGRGSKTHRGGAALLGVSLAGERTSPS